LGGGPGERYTRGYRARKLAGFLRERRDREEAAEAEAEERARAAAEARRRQGLADTACHVIDTRLNPRFLTTNGIL